MYYYYICSGRSHRTCTAGLCRADHIEAQVLTFVQQLQIPAAWHADILRYAEELLLEERQPARAQQDQAAIESKHARLAVLFEDGDMPVQTYRQKRDALRRELTALPTPQAVPDLAGALRYLHDFGALVAAADLEQRRALFRQLFSHLYVEGQDLKAITPTGLYLPLVGVLAEQRSATGVADGYQVPLPQPLPSPAILYLSPQKPVLIPR